MNGNAYKTAISRTTLSAPMRWINDNQKNLTFFKGLDYGCGKGSDANICRMDKYDPHFFPKIDRRKKYETITCNYVLNVVSELEEAHILQDIKSLLKKDGVAYISVRRDIKKDKKGFTNKRGTYQRWSEPNLKSIHKNTRFEIYQMSNLSKTRQPS